MSQSNEIVRYDVPGAPGTFIELTREEAYGRYPVRFGGGKGMARWGGRANAAAAGSHLAEAGFNALNAFARAGDTYRLTADSAAIVSKAGGLMRANDGGLLGVAGSGGKFRHMARFTKAGKGAQVAATAPMMFAAAAGVAAQIQMAEMQKMLQNILKVLADFKYAYEAEMRAEITYSVQKLREIQGRSSKLGAISDSDLRITEGIARDMGKHADRLIDIISNKVNPAWDRYQRANQRIHFVDEQGEKLVADLYELQLAVKACGVSEALIAAAHGLRGDTAQGEEIYRAAESRMTVYNESVETLAFRLHTMAYAGYLWHQPDLLSGKQGRKARIRQVAKAIEEGPLPIDPADHHRSMSGSGDLRSHFARLAVRGERIVHVGDAGSTSVTGKIRDEKKNGSTDFALVVTDKRVVVAHKTRFAQSGEQVLWIDREDIEVQLRSDAVVLRSRDLEIEVRSGQGQQTGPVTPPEVAAVLIDAGYRSHDDGTAEDQNLQLDRRAISDQESAA